MNDVVLQVQDLAIAFRQETVVDRIGFQVRRGETFALVGESGSGKSVTALGVMRLLPPAARYLDGRAHLHGEDLLRLPEWRMNRIRGRRIAMIFQDPMTCLNPVRTVGEQIGEVLTLHFGLRGTGRRRRVLELLHQVGIPEPDRRIDSYPHQLSGGQRQRAMIAIALAGEPDLLIADEPTTALDVTIQAQIMALLTRLQRQRQMALWLITHDLGLVADVADRAAVMQQGRILETFERRGDKLFERPQHPYTRKLLAALPQLDAARSRSVATTPPLLQVRDLKVWYPIRKGLLRRVKGYVKAVDGVSFTLERGHTLALVGESGCGKTTLGKAILQLIPATGGRIYFDGEEISTLPRKRRCRDMQIVFQDPFSAMNPRLLVGDIVAEGLVSLRPELSRRERIERVETLLTQVGLPPDARLRYPHEFSGGQRQRICIARALAVDPKLIVCDEPTSALDVSVQRQILDLLRDLQRRFQVSYLFISHDLAVVAEIAHQVAVMRQGRIVELGETGQVLFEPRHPYTRTLLEALPGKGLLARSDPDA
ncbi:microcin C transport system ATP-binding protein [Methylomarinovum caldicuralii]|uniref:ABC-type dipeptide transporter n=1 Tax=Methylomarinovum caldicuralii TaxID=438856 RepID=A0AAU9BXC1_9GAMM|nr:dipeptide ABC transporter ATP-binding protein [Methylomarinovum caldicuralii]BCX80890.1 microcin C transport system ATP-binding protein [Methylomarinovum caldicuralii]